MSKVTIDNITVEGELPEKVLRHAALKAKLLADTAPPWEEEREEEGKEGEGKEGEGNIPTLPPPPTLEQTRTWALMRLQREADERLEQNVLPRQSPMGAYL